MSGNSIVNSLDKKIRAYREQNLTGIVRVSSEQSQWLMYYLSGQIVWTKSRTHAIRRWLRHLRIHSPVLFEKIAQSEGGLPYRSWNYAALARLVKLKQFNSGRFAMMVEGYIAEDLFDMLQVGTAQHSRSEYGLTYKSYDKAAANQPFLTIHPDRVWRDARQEWQEWEQAGLAKLSPDRAPVITQREVLKQQTSPQTFQMLTTFLDGNNTIRDLAIKFRRSIVPIARSMLPYVHKHVLALTRVSDAAIDSPNTAALPGRASSGSTGSIVHPQLTPQVLDVPQRPARLVKSSAPRIIYIDDSPTDSQFMSEIIRNLGYRYTNIADPVQALPMLIELKPKIIFLDLVMPVANGYEICSQIRRISTLKNIPVIIVTSNDGIADRVRARTVGASGFLGKPIHLKKVEKVMKKHLIYDEHA